MLTANSSVPGLCGLVGGHQAGHQPLLHARLELVLGQLHLPLVLRLHDGVGPVRQPQLATCQLAQALVVLVLQDVARMVVTHMGCSTQATLVRHPIISNCY